MSLFAWEPLHDVWTVVHKELKELTAATGLSSLLIVVLACVVGVAGSLLPWWLGPAWFDRPAVMLLWLLLPIPLVIMAISESFAGERERHTLETLLATRLSTQAILLGKVIAAAIFGWMAALILLLSSLASSGLTGVAATTLSAPWASGAVLGLSLLVAIFTACIGVLISQDAANVHRARAAHSLAVVLIIVGVALLLMLAAQWFPGFVRLEGMGSAIAPAGVAAGLLLLVDLTLYAAAALRFWRTRLLAFGA